MKVRSSERVARINELELKHQGNVNQMELTGRDEEARLLKLRLLTLRDENASLKDRLVQRDALVKQLSKQSSDTQAELKTSKSKLKAQDTQIRKQSNALEDLKTEIDSLNEFRQDSNKVLQEKLALSRKLEQIQPELEHLQSQLENHRAIVAQKQDLERQLSSAEVELENEKRSNQRIQSKNQNNDDEWKEQFDEAKGEMERLKKEHSRELREVRGEYEMLEGRMEDTKSKLKKTQADLKDARAELASCRAELEEARKMMANNKLNKKNAVVKEQLVGKRRAHDISMEDISIGTPGPDETTLRRPFKKRGAEQALVGEKSTFSITPFLNRSKNLSEDMSDEPSEVHSPTGRTVNGPEPAVPLEEEVVEAGGSVSIEAIDEASGSDDQADGHVSAEEIEEPKTQKGRGRPRKALDEASTTKKNMPVQAKKKAKATKAPGKLAAVSEEAEIGEAVAEPSARPKKTLGLVKSNPTPALSKHGADDVDARKKKRKVLGGGNKTLFDDDDDAEPVPNPAKIQMGAGRRAKAPLGGARSAFGGATFSPLKKDRRGVGASFLH
ncbi:hypothetical protein FGSG_09868 [Fusarium graminearum PH-1]|uniref:Chromosome 1, complete genome n=1 Tax=Gibberella zeae (strain ATCC MYA-4620 / CBS 123657 / FGSC 9075 / NRRL 31084 / PH-1) TaxID=229533 RepID=I1RZL9_GIBZE|nr:hypothetical protein FGSG_09868 [Fusarium graminearum PH-1]ESU16508.1 hypothetical protein FGSG_09868 [Fusarium graminearum PH-1]EYB22201.1 hypothetical protein FG05_09868 [Fusarium graminearum]CEF75163.1 unnamed protein product [Fusarium graminearum]|eukprot:XP_011318770.1 hypothetical protein FGSG_09868 [Fusarium graminearum PH-1]